MGTSTIGNLITGSERRYGTLFWLWIPLAVLPIAFQLVYSLHHLKLSWDDGAITAAFARTWAETGKIALTPVSPTVEGFSSVLWFLLLSIPYFFTHNPDSGLIWMKILSAIFLLLSLGLLYLIGLRQFANRNTAIVPVLLLAFSYTQTQELGNGMEMNAAMFLLLLLFHVLTRDEGKRRILNGSIVVFLLLLTRFEMPFMLALLFCGSLYATNRNSPHERPSRDFLTISAISAALFALTELWRYHLFGQWMPNTVYAKRFAPYSDWSTLAKFLATRRAAVFEPIFVLPAPIALAIMGLIYGLASRTLRRDSFGKLHKAIWTLASGCFLFGAIFGRNWGIPGRMVAAMLPFLILALVEIYLIAFPRRLFTGIVALLLVFQGFTWLLLELQYPYAIVSLAHFEPFGIGADSIRTALHQDSIVIMMSDVGGPSLCCKGLDIIDLGLLTNPTLARTGWGNFPAYFQKVRPDLVQIHSNWATSTHIYDNNLLDKYSMVSANGVQYYLRDDLFDKLVREHAGVVLPVSAVSACTAHDSWNSTDDARFSLSKRTCLVLSRR